MSMSYFSNFPKVTYNGVPAVNLAVRAGFVQTIFSDPSVYYPYTIEEGETADGIATWYYGNSAYDWIIYMFNNIIDPYSQWPKTYAQMVAYLTKKYGSIESAQSNIEFYRRIPTISYSSPINANFSVSPVNGYDLVTNNEDIRVSVDSFPYLLDQSNYYPVYSYDMEIENNDNKRNILLLDNKLQDTVVSQLSSILNGG